jgi:prepilin-type N-terminal cleavage/methylation domain-containing protein
MSHEHITKGKTMQPIAVLKTRKGFTLIEVLSVVGIIAILAAIAIPSYKATMDRSREKAAAAAIAEVKSRLSLEYAYYRLKNPGSVESLTIKGFLNTTSVNDTSKLIKKYAIDIGDDFEVTLDPDNNRKTDITVDKIKDIVMTDNNSDEWSLPD